VKAGPRLTVIGVCTDCSHAVPGTFTRCAEPSVVRENADRPRSIGVTATTPEWCPVMGEAVAALVEEDRRMM
jgi:hypothetical protein